MPSTFDIPRRRERHCEPCEFHKAWAAMRGGPGNVWDDYNCMHPDAFGDMELSDKPETRQKQIELRARLVQHGRRIGRTERQPEWCPIWRKEREA